MPDWNDFPEVSDSPSTATLDWNEFPEVKDAPTVKPEGVLKTIGREFSSRIAPAAATGVGGVLGGLAAGALATPETVGIGTIPAAIAGDVLVGTAAGYAAEKAQNALMGEEWVKQNEAQRRANAEANPMSAQLGGLVPFLLSMVGGGYGREAFKGGAKVLTKAGEVAAKAGTAVPKIEQAAQAAAGGARAGGGEGGVQAADTGDFSHIPDDIAKSALAFGATGMFAPAKSILQAATGRAVKDAAAMTLANEIYDVARGKKDFDLKATANELGGSIPAFALQNAILGALHGRVIPGHALPLTAPKGEAAPAAGATVPPDTASDIDKVDLTVPPPEDTTAIANVLGQPAPRQPILSNVPDAVIPSVETNESVIPPEMKAPEVPEHVAPIIEVSHAAERADAPEVAAVLQQIAADDIAETLHETAPQETPLPEPTAEATPEVAAPLSPELSPKGELPPAPQPQTPQTNAATQRKIEQSDQPERANRDETRQAAEASRGNRAVESGEIPQVETPVSEPAIRPAAPTPPAPEVPAPVAPDAGGAPRTQRPSESERNKIKRKVMMGQELSPEEQATKEAELAWVSETQKLPADSPELKDDETFKTWKGARNNVSSEHGVLVKDEGGISQVEELHAALTARGETDKADQLLTSVKNTPLGEENPAKIQSNAKERGEEISAEEADKLARENKERNDRIRGLIARLEKPATPENIKKGLNVSEAGGKGAGMETPETPKRVRVAGAEYDVVQRNEDGTLKLKSEGGEFDTEPGEKWVALADTQVEQAKPIDTTKISREQYISDELKKADGRRALRRLEIEHKIRRDFKPSKKLPVGVSKIMGLLTKPKPTAEERAWIREYNNSAPSLQQDRRTEMEHAGRVWDAFNEKQKTKTPAAPSPAKVESDEGKLPSVATNPPGSSHPAVVDTGKKPESEGIASGKKEERLDPATLTNAQINKERAALSKERDGITERMIQAGRGSELSSETMKKSDPLAMEFRANAERAQNLAIESEVRMGSRVYGDLPTDKSWKSYRRNKPPPDEPGGSTPAPKEPTPKKPPSPTHLAPGDPVSFKQEGKLLKGEFVGINKDGTYAVKSGGKVEHVSARNLNDNNGGKVVEGTLHAEPSGPTNSMPHAEAQAHLDRIGVPHKKVRVVDKPGEFWQGRWNADGSIDLNTAHIGSTRELMDILFNHENTHDALMSGPEGPKLAKALEGFTDALSEKEQDEIHDALAGYREHGVSAEDMRQEQLVQMVRKLTENRPDLQTKWGRFVDSVTLAIKKFLGIKNLSRARAELLAAQILARGTQRVMRGEMNVGGGKGELHSVKPSPSAATEHEEAVARAEASYRKETAKDKIITAAKEVATGLRQVRSLLAPASVSPEAQLSAGFTRQRAAELEHRRQQGIEALKSAKKMFDEWGEPESIAFIDRLEKDQKQATPELEALAKTLRAALDSRVDAVRKLGTGKLANVIEDYFPHIWEKPDEAKSAYQRIFGKRPLEGSKAFLKQRTIPTTLEGMSWRVYDSKGDLVDTYKDEATAQAAAAGMTDAHVSAPMRPVTYNPVELTLMKIHEMDRYIMGQRLLADLKGQKLLTAVPYGQRPPQGYTAINDSIARTNIRNPGTGKMEPAVWHAPADASRVLNNYLSPGLRGVKVFDAWRSIGNAMNMAQLGISAFHAGMVSADSMISSGALGLEQLARGRFTEAAKSFAKIPVAPVYTMMKGHELMKQYKSDQSVLTPEQRKMIDSFTAAGGRASMDSFYRTGAVGSFTKALKAGNYPGAVFRLPFAALEAVSHPLMEFAVPRMKLGIFYDMAREELARMPATATQPEVQKRMGKIWDSIDNRMGQLVYDNLFWHKALKDTMMASVRSVGWNLGTIRELGGGFKDMLTVKSRLKDGGDFLTHRMAYTIMMPVVAGIIGGIYQYLKTGETPQDLKDWYMPRTGATKPDGSAERVELPTYMKDVVSYRHHPGQTILNKLHPLANSITEMYANKDFYGNEIRDSDAEPVKQLQQEVEFIARQFVPFTVRNAGQRQPGSGIGAESFFGINPAPAELTRSDAQNKMVDFIVNHSPQGGRTPEEAARTQARKDLLGRMRQGEDVRKELKESPLSVRQQKQVIRDSRTNPVLTMFKHLSASEAADVLELADEKEKEVLTKPFIAKYAKLPLKDKKEIQAKAKGGTLEALQRIGAIR